VGPKLVSGRAWEVNLLAAAKRKLDTPAPSPSLISPCWMKDCGDVHQLRVVDGYENEKRPP
jgi:hypothetical protein